MRKSLAIFMLLVMFIIGLNPVMALHYCAGELRSFEILNTNISKSCCESVKMQKHAESQDLANKHSHTDQTTLTHKDCCKTTTVELSTTEYQNLVQQFNLGNILPSFDNVWLTLYSLLSIDSEATSSYTQYKFPPGGFRLQNTDVLTYICISRI